MWFIELKSAGLLFKQIWQFSNHYFFQMLFSKHTLSNISSWHPNYIHMESLIFSAQLTGAFFKSLFSLIFILNNLYCYIFIFSYFFLLLFLICYEPHPVCFSSYALQFLFLKVRFSVPMSLLNFLNTWNSTIISILMF